MLCGLFAKEKGLALEYAKFESSLNEERKSVCSLSQSLVSLPNYKHRL